MTDEGKAIAQRINDAIWHLQKGLTPFVAAQMKQANGEKWLHYASRAAGSGPNDPLDAYGLLKTMIDNWRDAFEHVFARNEKFRVRNFLSTVFDARNAVSHLSLPLSDEDALRYLDAIHQLLKAVKAPGTEVSAVKALYDAQRASGSAGPITAAPTPPTAPATLDLAAPDRATRPLRPWIQVALPHPDVLENRFKEAEFAADLSAVDSGEAKDDYATPEGFFRITYLTEGLKRVLGLAMQRLTGVGGDPVIGLQTAFGGGKTHTMLALYHLARATDLERLAGVGDLAAQNGVTGWKPAKVAVFVGTAKGADMSLNLKEGPRVRTLWGYLAWRLAGEEGLAIIADAEAARTNPGSEAMVEVLKLAGPSIILLDELVAYARQLDDDRFEAFLSFVQSLTEAVKLVPHAMVIGSLPESQAEAGGPRGVAALLRLERVFGRIQSAWLPAGGNETYEIIRRRLFQPLDGAEAERARDETVKAFHDLYKRHSPEFPPEAREQRYLELLRLSYPIHPELFERLSKDWASLPKFQRTRGVLKFMANVVGVLWSQQVQDPLIMTSRIPISHERVRASVLYPLDAAFAAVVDREIDGDGSLAAKVEINPSRRISQMRAATRAARAVFLASAPLVGQANAGLNGPSVRLACVEPGDQFAVFGEALRELSQHASFLYEEAGRYWFATTPTLNRLADDRARALPDHVVDDEITTILQQDALQKGKFHKVFPAPDDPTSIDEASASSLVMLGPKFAHIGRKSEKSSATDAVTEALMRCRTGQRRFRNTLLFVAADESQLATAREAVRRAKSWREIVSDKQLCSNLTTAQIDDATEKAKAASDGALKAVRVAWVHVFVPRKDDGTAAGTPFEIEQLTTSARDRVAIPVSVYDKLEADGEIRSALGPETFSTRMKELWPEDRNHLAIQEVMDWFRSYVYLPKLRDLIVLEQTIMAAIGRLDAEFGFALSHSPSTDVYEGLTLGSNPPDPLPSSALLVAAIEARRRLEAMASEAHSSSTSSAGTPEANEPPELSQRQPLPVPSSPIPKRFYGTVNLDVVRPIKSLEKVIDAVVSELQRTPGVNVRISIEIEATAPGGFGAEEVSVIRDNASSLNFDKNSTGFE